MISMALISDLAPELSVMSGIPVETIAVVSRHLREAGLLSQRGRGRGAAKATPLDAARLCIALMVGGKAKNAPTAVTDFGALETLETRVRDAGREFEDLTLERAAGLQPVHSLEIALAALIDVWRNEDILARLRQFAPPEARRRSVEAVLNVSEVSGYIAFGAARYIYGDAGLARAYHILRRGGTPPGDPFEVAKEPYRRMMQYFSGIRTSRGVTGDELRTLGEVVADLREPGYRDREERWQQVYSGNPDFIRLVLESGEAPPGRLESDQMS
jgi:hypothetical protein